MEEEFKLKLRVDDGRSKEGGDLGATVVPPSVEESVEGDIEEEGGYDKSKSFFDNISCEAKNLAGNRWGHSVRHVPSICVQQWSLGEGGKLDATMYSRITVCK